MPFLTSLASNVGYGRIPVVVASDSPIVSGNATTTMNTTDGTVLSGITGVDDGFAYIPTDATFPFNFFGQTMFSDLERERIRFNGEQRWVVAFCVETLIADVIRMPSIFPSQRWGITVFSACR